MMIKVHSEDAKKLDFWLLDLKNSFEESNQGIILDYNLYNNDDHFTSVSFSFYPEQYRNEILIEILHHDLHEIMDKIAQRILNRCII